ncbi:MAG: ORF6N domain-containing protein [Rhodoferax sp.]|uniref:ORF6N domain-containing protein n=1 Tax=Rhodoferax sp. TaxID=50421 RepID=UPI003018BFDD
MTPKLLRGTAKAALSPQALAGRILVNRGQRVMLDADFADFYKVETRVFNQAVNRSVRRLPADFMFQLSIDEFSDLMSQFEMSS